VREGGRGERGTNNGRGIGRERVGHGERKREEDKYH
jgi:hypothetical protein